MGAMTNESPAAASIDEILASLEDAKQRADRVLDELMAEGAEDFLVEAVRYTRDEIAAAGKRLNQRTYFAVSQL